MAFGTCITGPLYRVQARWWWDNSPKAPSSSVLAKFALLLLGLCVIGWGTSYKLSLYDPPQSISHQMPSAKLLTCRGRIVLPVPALRAATGGGGRTPRLSGPVVSLPSVAILDSPAASLHLPSFAPSGRLQPGTTTWVFVRPPPPGVRPFPRIAPGIA